MKELPVGRTVLSGEYFSYGGDKTSLSHFLLCKVLNLGRSLAVVYQLHIVTMLGTIAVPKDLSIAVLGY